VELGLAADMVLLAFGEVIDDNNLMSGREAVERTIRKA